MVGLNVVRDSKTRLWVQCVPSSAATGGGRERLSQPCGRWRHPVPGGLRAVTGGGSYSPQPRAWTGTQSPIAAGRTDAARGPA